jgi:hypothetical protein
LGLSLTHLSLLPPGTLPLTTSGKLRRGAARRLFERTPAAFPDAALLPVRVPDAASVPTVPMTEESL